ncbi:hypothetical protein [Streptomyces mesophilus]|nr:hypothetical protein [Streptomyces mesophilus]
MLPDRRNGRSTGELAVPMAWLYAEYIADELLRTGDLVPSSTLEYRAGRQTLALTIYLSDQTDELSGIRVVSQLDEWLSLTAYGHPWQEWVRERMERRVAEGGGPDLALATETWGWLQRTELLAADLDSSLQWQRVGIEVDEDDQVWTPAWELGLPLGHLAIHLF